MGICLDKDLPLTPGPHQVIPVNGSSHLPDLHLNGVKVKEATNGHAVTDNANGVNTEEIIKNFQLPDVPVIFVLGGPGSGKITHCEQMTREKTGFVHISMSDIMNTMLKGTELRDSHVIPTRQITATLMASIKSKPGAEGFLVSGYPRNMRDTSEYLELLGKIDGVILLNWHLQTLERQIEYGAQLGEVELASAKVELGNFKKHVLPVAEFFDSKQMLHLVTGDRKPEQVYTDFDVVFHSLLELANKAKGRTLLTDVSYKDDNGSQDKTVQQHQSVSSSPALPVPSPPVLWVVGGPGSNKYSRVREAVKSHPRWTVLHTGKMFWDYLEKLEMNEGDEPNEDTQNNNNENKEVGKTLREFLNKGELVPQTVVADMLFSEIKNSPNQEGFIIVGFPRDLDQAECFEEKLSVAPVALLLDCSEMELGRNLGQRRGREDDNKAAVKRRLQVYREATLPMLKSLDEKNRLRVVDGDKETKKVMVDLKEAIEREIAALTGVEHFDEQLDVESSVDDDKTITKITDLEDETTDEEAVN